MIEHFISKIKSYLNLFIFILILLVISGFSFMYYYGENQRPISIVRSENSGENTKNQVYGSKNGSKYYLPWCGALNRIKPENRVVFATAVLARQAGFTPAQNCKGVE
jgi:hypothetical protein